MPVNAAEGLSHPVLQAFDRYWDALAVDRLYPIWHEIEPDRIPESLTPHLLVVERLGDGDFWCWLSGREADGLFGAVLQGKRLSRLQPAVPGQHLAQACTVVLAETAVQAAIIPAARPDILCSFSLLAPLSCDGRFADMILGVTVAGASGGPP